MQKTVKDKVIKSLKIVGTVIIYVFFAICLSLLVLAIVSERDVDGAVKMFGHEMRIVTSGSMEKNEDTWNDIKQYKIKNVSKYTAVFIDLVPDDEAEAEEWYSKLQVGDVLTFRYVFTGKQDTITHRIIEIEEEANGGYKISLKGDNVDDPNPQIIHTAETDSYNYVVGKVTGKSLFIGLITYELKQPLGLALIIIVPCVILIIYQIFKIVSVVNAAKREKAEEAAQSQLSEMEELKRRIAELEGGQPNGPPESESKPDEQ